MIHIYFFKQETGEQKTHSSVFRRACVCVCVYVRCVCVGGAARDSVKFGYCSSGGIYLVFLFHVCVWSIHMCMCVQAQAEAGGDVGVSSSGT